VRFMIIVKPGEQYGVCALCNHDECRRLREIALTACHLCQSPISFNRAYCYDADLRPVHYACLHAEVGRQSAMLGVEHEKAVTPVTPLLYDRSTAAELLNIGQSTLDAFVASDEISRVKIGTRVAFLPQHLISFIQRRVVRCKHDRENKLRAVN
jgi:hypothetical protein